MIKGRDFVITLCVLFLLLYVFIGDSSNNYWCFSYFTCIYTILFEAINYHKNKFLRLGIKVYAILMIIYTFITDILIIDIDSSYTTIVFIPLFITISILISRNNIYKQGFFR